MIVCAFFLLRKQLHQLYSTRLAPSYPYNHRRDAVYPNTSVFKPSVYSTTPTFTLKPHHDKPCYHSYSLSLRPPFSIYSHKHHTLRSNSYSVWLHIDTKGIYTSVSITSRDFSPNLLSATGCVLLSIAFTSFTPPQTTPSTKTHTQTSRSNHAFPYTSARFTIPYTYFKANCGNHFRAQAPYDGTR